MNSSKLGLSYSKYRSEEVEQINVTVSHDDSMAVLVHLLVTNRNL